MSGLKIVIPSHKRHDKVLSKKLVDNPIICVAESQAALYRLILSTCIHERARNTDAQKMSFSETNTKRCSRELLDCSTTLYHHLPPTCSAVQTKSPSRFKLS